MAIAVFSHMRIAVNYRTVRNSESTALVYGKPSAQGTLSYMVPEA